MTIRKITAYLLRFTAAAIMLQTLYFKFTAHPTSVELFTLVGMEPWGRIGTGVAELLSSLLLAFPATIAFGALLGLGLMSGAIFSHITVLGLDFGGDYVLFGSGVVTWACCAALLWLYRGSFDAFLRRFFR